LDKRNFIPSGQWGVESMMVVTSLAVRLIIVSTFLLMS
jgi:hypothetical protein